MKTSRRRFLAASTTTVASATLNSGSAVESPLFSFGLLADCQYADTEPKGTRFYRESLSKLEEAVSHLNEQELAFTLHLGDFIDRDFASFDHLDPIAKRLQAPLHHVLGNHDFDVEESLKSKVPSRLGMPHSYYALTRNGFRFLVLDTTEVSTYRHPKGSDAHRKAERELHNLQNAGAAGARPWNSRPGQEQLQWLETQLQEASTRGDSVLLFGHHPILPLESHAVWNAETMAKLLRKYPCAKAYLNGHNHAGHYVNADGFHYLTMDGMLETRETNAFAFANLYPDRLELLGSGRQESHTLKFR